MKKAIIIIPILILAGITGLLIFLGVPYDPAQSAYYHMEPPENLTRTIENSRAGNRTTYVEKSVETGGEYTLLEIELAPGGGNDPHHHSEFSEYFTAVSGTLGLWLNGEEIFLEEGESALADIGDEHAFFNPGGDTITFTVRIEPGHPGFEKSLYILYGLSNDGRVDEDGIPENIYHTAVFATLSDTGSSEVGTLLSWVIRRLAGRAQRMGIEDELIERYYLAMTE